MKNKYLKLTKDQKERGVIFSSQLKDSTGKFANGVIHEVFSNDENKDEKISRLSDSSFFKGSPWNVNEIRK